MARYDVYAHPDATLGKIAPFLLDVQNDYINSLDSRVVIPMRPAALYPHPMRDLSPVFEIGGNTVVLDTAALAAFPARELKNRVAGLQDQSELIVAAMDCLFGAY